MQRKRIADYVKPEIFVTSRADLSKKQEKAVEAFVDSLYRSSVVLAEPIALEPFNAFRQENKRYRYDEAARCLSITAKVPKENELKLLMPLVSIFDRIKLRELREMAELSICALANRLNCPFGTRKIAKALYEAYMLSLQKEDSIPRRYLAGFQVGKRVVALAEGLIRDQGDVMETAILVHPAYHRSGSRVGLQTLDRLVGQVSKIESGLKRVEVQISVHNEVSKAFHDVAFCQFRKDYSRLCFDIRIV